VASESVQSNVGIGLVSIDNTQGRSQVVTQRVQIAFCFLNLGELLGTAGLCDEVDRQLIGGSAADEVGEVGELQSWSGFLG
jgi:hypothetical protein